MSEILSSGSRHRWAILLPMTALSGCATPSHLDEAQGLFKLCVVTDASPESWQNLAAVYARKGDHKASRSALAAGAALTQADTTLPTLQAKAEMPSQFTDAGQRTPTENSTLAATGQSDTLAQTRTPRERAAFGPDSTLAGRLPNAFRR